VVPENRRQEALQANQTIETGTVRICLRCEAYIKPGSKTCPRCGVADERGAAQLRIEYDAGLQKHLASK
jgi:ribosomal protein L40E